MEGGGGVGGRVKTTDQVSPSTTLFTLASISHTVQEYSTKGAEMPTRTRGIKSSGNAEDGQTC